MDAGCSTASAWRFNDIQPTHNRPQIHRRPYFNAHVDPALFASLWNFCLHAMGIYSKWLLIGYWSPCAFATIVDRSGLGPSSCTIRSIALWGETNGLDRARVSARRTGLAISQLRAAPFVSNSPFTLSLAWAITARVPNPRSSRGEGPIRVRGMSGIVSGFHQTITALL